jgi:UDP-N-acetylglucosamine acyltransferase
MTQYNPLEDNNNIVEGATISPYAQIGKNNYFGHGTVIHANVHIGDNNYFGEYCIIGAKPESREYYKESEQKVIIGSNNRFIKQVTIDGSTTDTTIIMDNCEFLKNSHVGHDATIWNGVSLRCNAVVGGWCVIGKNTMIGLNASVHQRVEVPENVIIGANSFVGKKQFLHSGFIYGGVPVRQLKKIK